MVTNLRYADDIILLATSEEELQELVDHRTRLNREQALGASLQKIWKSHSIKITTKTGLTKLLVWPVAMYGCESWTLRKNEETCLDASEMKGLRKTAGFMDSKEKK